MSGHLIKSLYGIHIPHFGPTPKNVHIPALENFNGIICLINMSVLTQPSLSSLELFSSLTLSLERQVDCLCYAGRKGSQQLLIVALLRILDNQTVVTIVDTQKVIKLFSKPPSSFVSLSTFLKN